MSLISTARPSVRQATTSSLSLWTRSQSSPSSSFFPVQSSPSSVPSAPLPKPANSLFYTSRPSLNATLSSLQSSLTAARTHLFHAGLLRSISSPLSEFSQALPHPRTRRWKDQKEMAAYLRNGLELRSSQYRSLTTVLGSLEGLLPYAEIADFLPQLERGVPKIETDPVTVATRLVRPTDEQRGKTRRADGLTLGSQLEQLLRQFSKRTLSSTGVEVERISGKDRRLGKVLDNGLVKAVGRRKESAAQVWIVPVQPPASQSTEDLPIPGRVLVNSQPLPSYFTLPAHRSASIHPLSLTSTLGSFNVFAITKGGGLAAQADAVAMGLARALVEWERCEVEAGRLEDGKFGWREILKRADLLERDPRMVERKKTGQPKARKKNTWVKR